MEICVGWRNKKNREEEEIKIADCLLNEHCEAVVKTDRQYFWFTHSRK